MAIHRWFAGGEGWAYHPWYDDRKPELLTALKVELENRRAWSPAVVAGSSCTKLWEAYCSASR